MRRLVLITAVAAALTIVGAARAAPYGSARLSIVTVPRLAGIRFSLDGRVFVTGKSGHARIETTRGVHVLSILDTYVQHPGVRSTFLRWEDGRFTPTRLIRIEQNTELDVGFQQSVLVHFGFHDIEGHPVAGRVTKVTISNTLGSRSTFEPEWSQWLRASGVMRRFNGLQRTLVEYSIQRAIVGGSNVVNQSQQRFYPALQRHFSVRLLLYSAQVSVRDFVFGTPVGSELDLVYPDGTRTAFPLKGRRLLLASLPRGTYRVSVQAGGYVPAVSLALSKNQVLQVKVVSYVDMLLFLGVALGAITALVLIPRPYLRLRLRSIGSGRRPTPDDLEPPKPLAGERRQLIFRYMVAGLTVPSGTRSVPRLPARAVRDLVVADTAHAPDPLLSRFLSRLRALGERLRGLQNPLRRAHRPRLRPPARSRAEQEVLSGSRIELIQVYMGGSAAPAHRPAPAPQLAQQPETAAGTPEEPPARVLFARQRAALARLRHRVRDVPGRAPEAVPSSSPAAVETVVPRELPHAAPAIAVEPAPAVVEDAAPAAADAPPVPDVTVAPATEPSEPAEAAEAPAEAAEAPAGPEQAEPATEEPAAEEPALEEPEREQPAPKPTRRRAPAKPRAARTAKAKPAAAAKRKTTRAAKPKPKTTRAKKASAPTPTPASGDGTNGQDLALLRPDLAAAVEALQEDLRQARTKAPAGSRKRVAAPKDQAAAKPKRARVPAKKKAAPAADAEAQAGSANGPAKQAKPKAAKPKKATKPAGNGRPARRAAPVAEVDAGTAASEENLALLPPDLASAVEALKADLRSARTPSAKKGRRKSPAKAPQ